MGKIMLFSNKFISFVFYAITMHSYIDVFKSFLSFTESEVLGVKNVCSIIVAVFASAYWIQRAFNEFFVNRPFKKYEEQMKKEQLEFEKKIRVRKEKELKKQDYEEVHQSKKLHN